MAARVAAISTAEQPRCVRGARRDEFSQPTEAGQGGRCRRPAPPVARAHPQALAAPDCEPLSAHAARLVAAEGCMRRGKSAKAAGKKGVGVLDLPTGTMLIPMGWVVPQCPSSYLW